MSGNFSYSSWYAVNGKSLNERRKQRYANDPEYKARVTQINNESRERQREKTSLTRKERVLRGPAKSEFRYEIDGVEVFTISTVAEMLGVSVQTLRNREKQKAIPEATYRSDRGVRLYSKATIDRIKRILDKLPKSKQSGVKRQKLVQRRIRYNNGTIGWAKLYQIGALAKALNRKVATVETMERKGYLPKTPFTVESSGRRLYTEEMIDTVKAAFERFAERAAKYARDRTGLYDQFRTEITEGWAELGVTGAYFEEEQK